MVRLRFLTHDSYIHCVHTCKRMPTNSCSLSLLTVPVFGPQSEMKEISVDPGKEGNAVSFFVYTTSLLLNHTFAHTCFTIFQKPLWTVTLIKEHVNGYRTRKMTLTGMWLTMIKVTCKIYCRWITNFPLWLPLLYRRGNARHGPEGAPYRRVCGKITPSTTGAGYYMAASVLGQRKDVARLKLLLNHGTRRAALCLAFSYRLVGERVGALRVLLDTSGYPAWEQQSSREGAWQTELLTVAWEDQPPHSVGSITLQWNCMVTSSSTRIKTCHIYYRVSLVTVLLH